MGRALATALLGCQALLLCMGAQATDLNQRRHILISGSSTAYPIVSAAAERFGRRGKHVTPVVESTGTGGGIKLFCAGTGLATPDIAMASRRMKDSEREDCARNHVNDVREIKIGYDGIVIASTKEAPRLSLTTMDIYLALAREVPGGADGGFVANHHQSWNEIDPALPAMPIRVLGPPPTSGTRDMLLERLLLNACLDIPALKALHGTDPALFNQRCFALREDGLFVNAGENDARLVRKLLGDPQALGIFGYNFLERNRARLQAASIDGIEPQFELIESGAYPLSRALYLYIKPHHASVVGGLDDFVDEILSPAAAGTEGYLVDQGLIPLPVREPRPR
jgi:phosphate transport system substrate-binding protein